MGWTRKSADKPKYYKVTTNPIGSKAFNAAPNDVTDEILDETDAITIPPVDEVNLVAKPDTVAEPWVVAEYNAYAGAQPEAWAADGEEAASAPAIDAAESEFEAAACKDIAQGLGEDWQKAKADEAAARKLLRRFTRRERRSKRWYVMRWAVLLLGDIAGITGAAILMGELVALAVLQAAASGMAAVTAGLVGGDVREMQRARRHRRDPKDLTPAEQEFAHLFAGPDMGEVIVKLVVLVGAALMLVVAGGILALRAGADSVLAGIVFGALALGIGGASFVNCWTWADAVQDLLDNYAADTADARRRYRIAIGDPVIKLHDGAVERVRSIREQYRLRGEAGTKFFRALGLRILRRNPGTFGHGPAPQPASPTTFVPGTADPATSAHRNGKVV